MNKIGALLMEMIDTNINLRRVITADLLVLINTGAKVTLYRRNKQKTTNVATLSRQ